MYHASMRRRACGNRRPCHVDRHLLAVVWQRGCLPFWPCTAYMLAGKFLRNVTMAAVLLYVFPGAIPGFT